MTLDFLAAKYAAQCDIAPGTAQWLRYVAANYSRFLGHPAAIADVNDGSVNAWLAAMLANGLARRTVRSYRGAMLMLWRFAIDGGLTDASPAKLRKVKVERILPLAWTERELVALLDQALSLGGRYKCGVSRSTFWAALILVLWDTGMRIGDALRLRRDQINQDGRGCIVQGKTEWPLMFQLSPRTLAAVRELESEERLLLFGDCLSRDWVFEIFKRLATGAGLVGGTKKIRKSGATAVERATPGSAMGYLGHKSPGLAYQYYVDPRIVGEGKPMPPPLLPPFLPDKS